MPKYKKDDFTNEDFSNGCVWNRLVSIMGEKEARKELARQLRLAADYIEKDDFTIGNVVRCDLMDFPEEMCKDGIDHISVTLSKRLGC